MKQLSTLADGSVKPRLRLVIGNPNAPRARSHARKMLSLKGDRQIFMSVILPDALLAPSYSHLPEPA
jgi:hypothetical protein